MIYVFNTTECPLAAEKRFAHLKIKLSQSVMKLRTLKASCKKKN